MTKKEAIITELIDYKVDHDLEISNETLDILINMVRCQDTITNMTMVPEDYKLHLGPDVEQFVKLHALSGVSEYLKDHFDEYVEVLEEYDKKKEATFYHAYLNILKIRKEMENDNK